MSKAQLPTDSKARKSFPITTGVLHYFPDAIAEVARLSKLGNDKHNPGQPLHWSRDKSSDHLDCIGRHLTEVGGYDPAWGEEKVLFAVELAWRALANAQLEIEALRAASAQAAEGAAKAPASTSPRST